MRTRDAHRARQDVIASCGTPLDRATFYEQVTEVLARVIPFDGSCWHTMDPGSGLITSHRTSNLPNPEEGFPMLCANEYLVDDFNKFTDLAARAVPVGVLSETTGGHPEASLRYREFLSPGGLDGELRVAFTDGTSCWGSLILVREPGRDFSHEEADFIASVCKPIAHGLRRTLLVDATVRGGGRTAPGMIVVGADGRLDTLMAPARYWLGLLGAEADPDELPPAVLAVVAAVRRAVGAGNPVGVRVSVHTESGQWVELHGARADGGVPGRVAVILDAAPADQVAPITLAASGLTRREREVVSLVVQGFPTKSVASRLGLSIHTVQDHLRAIFEKLGVHSKQELVARVFFHDQLPRIMADTPIGPDGSLEE